MAALTHSQPRPFFRRPNSERDGVMKKPKKPKTKKKREVPAKMPQFLGLLKGRLIWHNRV